MLNKGKRCDVTAPVNQCINIIQNTARGPQNHQQRHRLASFYFSLLIFSFFIHHPSITNQCNIQTYIHKHKELLLEILLEVRSIAAPITCAKACGSTELLPHGVAASLCRRHQKTVTGTAVEINVHAQVKAEEMLKKARRGDPI